MVGLDETFTTPSFWNDPEAVAVTFVMVGLEEMLDTPMLTSKLPSPSPEAVAVT